MGPGASLLTLLNVIRYVSFSVASQSAGAGSVEAQLLFPSSRKLFRAAILDSSTGPL